MKICTDHLLMALMVVALGVGTMYGIVRRHVWIIIWAVVAASVLAVALALGPTVGQQEAVEAAAQSPAEQSAWQIPIGISEICPVPATGQSTWVELMNFGEDSVQIGGWCLSDTRGTRYVFPQDLPPVPPKGIVLVNFQGPASPPNDDKDFSGDHLARLYSRAAGTTNSFAGDINECALYTSADAKAEQIVDYVPWGDRESTQNSDAAHTSALWLVTSRPVFVAAAGVGGIGLTSGGSIGRMAVSNPAVDADTGRVRRTRSSDWDIYFPEDVTRGKKNTWPSPRLYGPSTRVSYAGGPTVFSWRWPASLCRLPNKENWTDHIQVATDGGLRNLVIDKYVTGPYRHVPPLEPGQYYWRVRAESDGDRTPWMPTTEFEIMAD